MSSVTKPQPFSTAIHFANNNTRGPCPGYVVDHIQPLKRGGADHPSNMQWQTVEEGKAKDRWE